VNQAIQGHGGCYLLDNLNVYDGFDSQDWTTPGGISSGFPHQSGMGPPPSDSEFLSDPFIYYQD
jgi:hypothetical protein